jgi:hypothetical protein
LVQAYVRSVREAGEVPTAETWTLGELRWHWGGAYEITNRGPGWRARRKDGLGGWLAAPDPRALVEMIRADYQRDPVSRDVG